MMRQLCLQLNDQQLLHVQGILADNCHRYGFAALLSSQGNTNDRHARGKHRYDLIAGFGVHEAYSPQEASSTVFSAFSKNNADKFLFGHLAYDFKNSIEPKLSSRHADEIGFALLQFVAPQLTVLLIGSALQIDFEERYASDAERLKENILSGMPQSYSGTNEPVTFNHPGFEDYQKAFTNIVSHLQRGDIYEINYCIPLKGKVKQFDPVEAWKRLSKSNPSPFSCLYRVNDSWLISASPERFIRKEGTRLFSQPMKGTARRLTDLAADEIQREALLKNQKEISENIMIVDLVRNDLSRVALRNTVEVTELCGLYSFPKVHQLISTVSAQINPETKLPEIIKALFPMGSMTGAPKQRAMEIIDETELFSRGIFSGTVGYLTPERDFDFNVVIRSLLYNAVSGDLLIPVGSAITIQANAADEYQECLLKAEAMTAIVNGASYPSLEKSNLQES